MAIDPSARYGGQLDLSDPAFPHGKPRNVSTPGDGTGTPFEAGWLSDLFGWQQDLLDAAGLTPSDVPDQVGSSQYNAGIRAIVAERFDADGRVQFPAAVTETVVVPAAALTVNNPDPTEFSRTTGGIGIVASEPGILRTLGSSPDVDAWLALNRYLPSDAVLTRVRAAAIFDDTGVGAALRMYLETYGVNWATWVASGANHFDSEILLDEKTKAAADPSARYILDSGAIALGMLTKAGNPASRSLRFQLVGEGQHVFALELTFTHSGLRNT